jgi:hypothetical protein
MLVSFSSVLSSVISRILSIIEHPLSKNPPELDSLEAIRFGPKDALVSFSFAIFSSLILATSILSWTYHSIDDGSAYDNSRWGRMGDAYETISDSEARNVVFIGSSIFYHGIDGACIDESTSHGLENWNLAVRGDVPYLRLPETDYIVASGAEIVVLEAGPNTFQDGLGAFPESRLRWEVFSLHNDVDTSADWREMVMGMDREFILDDPVSKLQFLTDSTGTSLDELAHRTIYMGESRRNLDGTGMLPDKGSEDWISSLKSPPFSNEPELSDEEFEIIVERLVNGQFWKPVHSNHRNMESFNYIVSQLEESGIVVVLLSLPLHSEFQDSLKDGWWDPFNETKLQMSEERDFIDLTWEDWPDDHFVDPVHLSTLGRQKSCEVISASLDQIAGV